MHIKHSIIDKVDAEVGQPIGFIQDEFPDDDFLDLPDSEPLITVGEVFSESVISPRLLSYLLAKVKEFERG